MPEDDLPVKRGVVIPASELTVTTAHSGGPGGQNVNKVETKVVLRWSVAESDALGPVQRERVLRKLSSRLTRDGELLVTASSTRSREQNRADARRRLAELVRDALAVPKPRRKTRPTRASKKRRIDEKRRRGRLKRERGKPPPTD